MKHLFTSLYQKRLEHITVNHQLRNELRQQLFEAHSSRSSLVSFFSRLFSFNITLGIAGVGILVIAAFIGNGMWHPKTVTAEELLKHAGALMLPKLEDNQILTVERTIQGHEEKQNGTMVDTTTIERIQTNANGDITVESRTQDHKLLFAYLYKKNGKAYGYGYDKYTISAMPYEFAYPMQTPPPDAESVQTIIHEEMASSQILADTSLSETEKQKNFVGENPEEVILGDSLLRAWVIDGLETKGVTTLFNEPYIAGEETVNGVDTYKIIHEAAEELTTTAWIDKDNGKLIKEESESTFDLEAAGNAPMLLLQEPTDTPNGDSQSPEEPFSGPPKYNKTIVTYSAPRVEQVTNSENQFSLDYWKNQYGKSETSIKTINRTAGGLTPTSIMYDKESGEWKELSEEKSQQQLKESGLSCDPHAQQATK